MRGRRCLPSRRRDFRERRWSSGHRTSQEQPQVPHEGHSPNMIELGFIVCRISRHLSANIACPLLMDNENSGTSQRPRPVLETAGCIETVSKPIF